MNAIFKIVYLMLMDISAVTGLTYTEVNIIVYYGLLPFIYVFLADKILNTNILKIAYVAAIATALVSIRNFSEFSDWLFDKSVDFLLSFDAIGWNYTVASVMVCVILPGIVLIAMLNRAYPCLLLRIRQHFNVAHHRVDGMP